MRLLVLGGTTFVGRHIVSEALSRGLELTLFNRGSRPEVFPEVERLKGDRDGDLTALQGRTWDAVIDTSGYLPRVVRASAELLEASVEHYTFISSISVYKDQTQPHITEEAELAELEDESVEKVTGETYGGLKVLCERVVEEVYGERSLIIRPGLIVGPYDPTDRFTYWPQRVAEGGEVLAPEGGDLPVQFIDARDLAAWTLGMVERRESGTYNAVSPAERFSLGELLETCQRVSGSDATFTWVDGAWLVERGVKPFMDLPLWIPGEEANLSRVSNKRAAAQGLSIRGLEETVRDTLSWSRTRPADTPRRAGLDREREAELLRDWHVSQGNT